MDWARRHARGLIGLGLYGVLWAAAALVLGVGAEDAVPVMAVFGVALPLVAWLVTLGERAPAPVVRRPGVELGAVLAYLAAYAVLFTGWGLSAFKQAVPAGRTHEILLLLLKLGVHVVLPILVLLAVGGAVRPLFGARIRTRGFWLGLVVLGAACLGILALISPSLKQIAGLHAAPPTLALAVGGAFLWLALEAGLCEEFLFRAVLQSRLAAVLKSDLAAALIGALLFAMAHVPGLWLRSGADVAGHSQSLLEVTAYAVAILSPAGLFLGVVWMRTRSLLLVVLLHALIDVLPNTAEFARTWLGA